MKMFSLQWGKEKLLRMYTLEICYQEHTNKSEPNKNNCFCRSWSPLRVTNDGLYKVLDFIKNIDYSDILIPLIYALISAYILYIYYIILCHIYRERERKRESTSPFLKLKIGVLCEKKNPKYILSLHL